MNKKNKIESPELSLFDHIINEATLQKKQLSGP